MKSLLLSGSLLLAGILPSSAQSISDPYFLENNAKYGLVHHINIDISDQVSGNCWRNASLVKSKTKLTFEQSNIGVIPYEVKSYINTAPLLSIVALGYRLNSQTCAGVIIYRVEYNNNQSFGGEDGKQVYIYSNVISLYSRSAIAVDKNLDSFIEKRVEEFTADFLSKVLSGKREAAYKKLKQDYPFIGRKPISKEEYDEWMESRKP